MNDLLRNINKVHTTQMGLIRIKRNLELQTEKIVEHCITLIHKSSKIERTGKN